MKMFRTALFALATLAVVPSLAVASQAHGGAPQKSPTTTAPKAAVRAVAGVVKSVVANSLVITTVAGKEKAQELTFVLNPATQKKGTIAAGARVSVRYQVEGGKNVASAITVEQKGK